MGDINIDLHDKKCVGYKQLTEFLDVFNLSNLIKEKTCFFKDHESLIDVILTNKPRRFINSQSFEFGVSDCQKMIVIFLRMNVALSNTKNVKFCSRVKT